MKKTEGWKNAGLCAVMLVLLYLCRDSMYFGMLGFYKAIGAAVAVFCGLLIGFLVYKRRELVQQIINPKLGLWAVCAVLVLVPMAVKRDWQLMYINVLFAITLSILFSYLTSIRRLARCFLTVLAVLAVYSLVCTYGLRILVDRGVLQVPVYTPGDSFLDFGLCMGHLGYLRNRNMGLFREPGVYQYFLLLALYLNNYQAQWEKKGIYWGFNLLFGLTMLTTFATGGVIAMGLLAIFVFFDKGWHKTTLGRLGALGAVAALVIAYLVVSMLENDISGNLYMMFYKLFSDEDSWVERTGSFVLNFRLFASSPLVGVRVYDILENPLLQNNTSSTTILLCMLGVFGGGMHILSWLALVWEKRRSLLGNLLLAAIVSLSFNTENLITDPFLWLFPMMAMAEKLLPAWQERRRLHGK